MDKPPKLTVNGQPVGETIVVPQMPDDVLRRMNHAEWLGNFSSTLAMSIPGRANPMTPFRAGAITRLQLAKRYVELLEHENRMFRRKEKADEPAEPAEPAEGR